MKLFSTLLVLIFPLIVFTGSCNDENEKPDPAPHWERVNVYINEPYVNLTDIDFLNNDYGVICGSSGTIIITENAITKTPDNKTLVAVGRDRIILMKKI